jgi:MFS family permease
MAKSRGWLTDPRGRLRPRRRVSPEHARAVLRPVLIGTVLVTLFAFFFVYPTHDPEPNGLPVAVVDGVDVQLGDGFDVVGVDDEAEAREAILDREAYGAFLPGPPPQLLVASAASVPVAQALAAAAERGPTPSVPEDIRPVDEDDPRGVSINFVGLAVTITSILGALLLFNLAPTLPVSWRLASLALFSVLGGALAMLVVQVGIGVLPGSYFALAAVAALAIFAVASVSAAIIGAIGFPGVGLSFMLFLMLGNPGSGAASAPELLPEPWKTGGQFLPPGAAATGIRNVAYFDAAQAEMWLTVLVVYAVIGIASLVTFGRRSASRSA